MVSETVANVDFKAFYTMERKSLVRFVMFLGCTDAGIAEDIAQTAFTRAFPLWHTIAFPQAWLRKVAQHEYIRYCQGSRREVALDLVIERTDRPSAIAAAMTLEQQADTRAFLTAGVAALPPTQRQVMAWYWDGFGDAEIAAELGISEAAVRKNRSRAMKTLRRTLGTRRDAK